METTIICDREKVIKSLSGEGYIGETTISCPNCGCDYTHILTVGTLTGSDQHEPDSETYAGTIPIGKSPSRRSALKITFECEGCPQLFALIIQQHKGINILAFEKDA